MQSRGVETDIAKHRIDFRGIKLRFALAQGLDQNADQSFPDPAFVTKIGRITAQQLLHFSRLCVAAAVKLQLEVR